MSKGLELVRVILCTGKSPESRARHFSVDSSNSQDVNVMQDVLISALTEQNVLKRRRIHARWLHGSAGYGSNPPHFFTSIGISLWRWTGEPL